MRNLITLSLLLVSLNLSGKIVYVSSSIGDDSNSGLSQDSPLKNLETGILLGDTILVKSGDIFYGGISLNHKVLSSYGNDRLPIISGYKRPMGRKWKFVSPNVWAINLAGMGFTGAYSNSGSSYSNNIGCIHNWETNKIFGRRVQYKSELNNNWDFWQTEQNNKNISPDKFDELYLYYDGDPNTLSLEFASGDMAIIMRSSTVENITIMGFGFGISAGTNSIIRECSIDAIGGMQALGNPTFCSYGNGIEFYVSKNISNCLVSNCTISRCFDCGISIQGSNSGKATPTNIIIRGNLIYDCCQGWEDFLRNDPEILYNNCIFENNVVLNSGESGFGYSDGRSKYCHLLGNNFCGDRGMIIRNNIFIKGNYYCSSPYNGKYTSNKWDGNICFIGRGDFLLSNYRGTADVLRVPMHKGDYRSITEATKAIIERYRYLTNDYSTNFRIVSSTRMEKLIKHYKKAFRR